ncbi:hypothetical protein [Photobacterium leiognathi]|uniref:hypothetical protein n=1 Tax=Photobacterium leiognathi TaxID=553611 RepID=UPI002980CE7B|nr:hypothetical protein [Photobacterium leiognathi]
MKELMLNRQFNEESVNARQEMFSIDKSKPLVSDDVGRFAAKQLGLEDIARRVEDDDYLISIYLLKQQVIHERVFLESMVSVDITHTISADTAVKMDFETRNYATLSALIFAVEQQRNGEDPFDNVAFIHLVPRDCDDLNRLVSANEKKLSQILSDDEFAAFGDEFSAMLQWVSDPARRYSQVPPSGRYPVTDPSVHYDFSDLANNKGLLLPELEKRLALRCQALLGHSLQSELGEALTLERYCSDKRNISTLSRSLKFDETVFASWLDKAISEQFRNTSKALGGVITQSTSEDKRIYRDDVINTMINQDEPIIVTHPTHKATSKLRPFLCTESEVVIAVEMTKFGSIFMPRWCADKDLLTELPDGMYKHYDAVTPETTPYGRNSNLRQIPELAWCELLKVKIRTQDELDNVINLISE